MNNDEITIYSEKGRKLYALNRNNLIKLEKQYPSKTELGGCGGSVHSQRQKKILSLIEILLRDKASERNISDLANDVGVVPAKITEYLYQIYYSINHLK